MPDLPHLLAFMLAGWLLNLTPGPDVLYIVSNALRSGLRAGIVAGLGITAGCFVHIFAAALGVGALMASSAFAFALLKYIGAAYLFYLGLRMLLARPAEPASLTLNEDVSMTPAHASASGPSLWAIFRGGFWTNALNPKVALFFLAFVPQFIDPQSSSKTLYFVLLGVLFNVNAIPVNIAWARAAGAMARSRRVQRGMQGLDRVAGLMFIGFGLKLALSDAPTSGAVRA